MDSLTWFISGPLLYIAVITFVVVTGKKILYFSSMPRHLRWDLYPVPHQGPEGSKYQKVDFSKLKPQVHLMHELWEMGQEILFIKRAFKNNPKIWKSSFPLHAGIYLCAVWMALVICGAIVELAGIPVYKTSPSTLAVVLYYATILCGVAGAVTGLAGTIGLLWMRYFDEGMRDMADFITYVNLYLMLLVFGSALLAWWNVDPGYNWIRSHTMSLVTLKPVAPDLLIAMEIFWFSVFLLYLPFSRMLHFVAKYYFYHDIMWDDESMKPGSKLEQDVIASLHYKLNWNAPHITSDAAWVDQIPADRKEEDKK
ncbi:MAG: Nitrate reductase gamma subunit [Firmicutes bacterium]|nr:Nitrate reductase gamma subunit [Bacillota bacterium]